MQSIFMHYQIYVQEEDTRQDRNVRIMHGRTRKMYYSKIERQLHHVSVVTSEAGLRVNGFEICKPYGQVTFQFNVAADWFRTFRRSRKHQSCIKETSEHLQNGKW